MTCTIGSSYTIQADDILFDIAERKLGDGNRWREIMKPNGTPFTEKEAENLQEGQEICLPNGQTSPPPSASGELTPEQKRRAEQFTSIFENDTIELKYDYAEDVKDKRGITCGRAGFTTKWGDALDVVELYTEKVPDNVLAKFLPELKRLANNTSGDTSGLDGFINAWKKSAKDSKFRGAQDEINDRLYYQPSVKLSNNAGLRTALARAAVYDTIIQHGEGDDLDGLPAILKRTQKQVGGTPKTGVDEKEWLEAFIKIRRKVLEHAHNPETREVWAKSVDRCDALLEILKKGNFDLHGPIRVKTIHHDKTIP
jgi:chitosanase